MQSTGYSSAVPQTQDEPGSTASASSDAFKKLLTGSGSGQMNLRAVRLSAAASWLVSLLDAKYPVKERAQALRRSLDEFIEILQFQPHRLTWEDSLDRFGVMGVRHQQLMQQIRPLLQFYVAHPKAVNQSNAELIPLLLSTMKLPEMDAEENELLQSTPAAGNSPPSFEELGNVLDQFNGLVDELTRHVASAPASGVLDPKGPKRREMAQQLRVAVNKAEAPPPPAQPLQSGDPAARALLEAAMTGIGL